MGGYADEGDGGRVRYSVLRQRLDRPWGFGTLDAFPGCTQLPPVE